MRNGASFHVPLVLPPRGKPLNDKRTIFPVKILPSKTGLFLVGVPRKEARIVCFCQHGGKNLLLHWCISNDCSPNIWACFQSIFPEQNFSVSSVTSSGAVRPRDRGPINCAVSGLLNPLFIDLSNYRRKKGKIRSESNVTQHRAFPRITWEKKLFAPKIIIVSHLNLPLLLLERRRKPFTFKFSPKTFAEAFILMMCFVLKKVKEQTKKKEN